MEWRASALIDIPWVIGALIVLPRASRGMRLQGPSSGLGQHPSAMGSARHPPDGSPIDRQIRQLLQERGRLPRVVRRGLSAETSVTPESHVVAVLRADSLHTPHAGRDVYL